MEGASEVGKHGSKPANVRIGHQHKRNDGGYRDLVGPETEDHIERYDFERNKCSFEGKEIDPGTETEGWINKDVCKSNLH